MTNVYRITESGDRELVRSVAPADTGGKVALPGASVSMWWLRYQSAKLGYELIDDAADGYTVAPGIAAKILQRNGVPFIRATTGR